MNIYRWENGARVVEIMARDLKQARIKGSAYLSVPALLLTSEPPGDIRACSRVEIGEDCVKTWTKH